MGPMLLNILNFNFPVWMWFVEAAKKAADAEDMWGGGFGAWSVLWRRQKRRRMRRICGGQVCSGTLPRGLLWQPECDHLDQRPARRGVLELSRQPQGRIRLQALQGPES